MLKLLPIFFLLLYQSLSAQDIHFSQYWSHPLYLNPAQTGVFDADYRVGAIYRTQWQAVPVPYLTFIGSYDTKLFTPRWGKSGLGVGGFLNTDRAGDSKFTTLQIGLSGSYIYEIEKGHFLSVGIQTNFTNQAFQPDELTFDEQFDGESFNSNIVTTEIFEQTSTNVLDYVVGINYNIRTRNRTGQRTDAHMSLTYSHLSLPKYGFYRSLEAHFFPKVTTSTYGRVMLEKEYGFSVGAYFAMQGLGEFDFVYQESLVNIGLIYVMNEGKENEVILNPSLIYRFGESLIPSIEMGWQDWRINLSYDITVSKFIAATNRRGAMELSMRYVWKRVLPPRESKVCPVF